MAKIKLDASLYDRVKNITENVNRSRAARPVGEQRRVCVELPLWVVESLDREASRLGVTRQSVIKMCVTDLRGKAT